MGRRNIVSVVVLLTTLAAGASGAGGITTQSRSTDCGPAALATLLRYYLDIPTTEDEMLRLSGYRADRGTSLLGLEDAAVRKGCVADSFRMYISMLSEQIRTHPVPVIVRTLNPEPHFSLLLGLEGDHAFLADPASGHVALRRAAFLRRWCLPGEREGFVFVAVAADRPVNSRRLTATLASLRRRLSHLENARTPLFYRH